MTAEELIIGFEKVAEYGDGLIKYSVTLILTPKGVRIKTTRKGAEANTYLSYKELTTYRGNIFDILKWYVNRTLISIEEQLK